MAETRLQMEWRALLETCLPEPGILVVLRMSDRIIPRRGDSATQPETSGRSLMLFGREYGYQLGILRYAKDGFGRRYPAHFEILSFTGKAPEFHNVVQIADVAYWAELT